MTIFHRLPIIASLFPAGPQSARDAARRWVKAGRAQPELAHDLIRLGDVLALSRVQDWQAGVPQSGPIDPLDMAYQNGRRDMALQLLALMGMTIPDLNTLMENDDA